MIEYNYKNITNKIIEGRVEVKFTPSVTSVVSFSIPLLMPYGGGNIPITYGTSKIINAIPPYGDTITINYSPYIRIRVPGSMTIDLKGTNPEDTVGLIFYIAFINGDIQKPIVLRRKDMV